MARTDKAELNQEVPQLLTQSSNSMSNLKFCDTMGMAVLAANSVPNTAYTLEVYAMEVIIVVLDVS